MRVVLDTNVIVAGLAYPSGAPGRIVAAWRRGALQVVLSPWILTECERVLPRLRPHSTLSPQEVHDLVEQLAFSADMVKPDPAALLASGAELLVTGDKDLRVLATRFAVLTPAEFCARHSP